MDQNRITIEHLRAHCINTQQEFTINTSGGMWMGRVPISTGELRQLFDMPAEDAAQDAQPMPATFSVPGYDDLAAVLLRAYDQAARGKGKERHANGEPFSHQVMQDGARRFGVGSLLFQAFKKSEESQRLPHDRAVAELLGAIVYLAGAVIAMERKAAGADPVLREIMRGGQVPPQRNPGPPANDNAPCCTGGHQTEARCAGCTEAKGLQAEALQRR